MQQLFEARTLFAVFILLLSSTANVTSQQISDKVEECDDEIETFSFSSYDESESDVTAEETCLGNPTEINATHQLTEATLNNTDCESLIPSSTTPMKDHLLKWNGDFSIAYNTTKNTALLNNSLPDATNWIKTAFGLKMNYSIGKEKYGHDAVLVHGSFKHKNYWGAPAIRTSKEKVPFASSMIGAHSHSIPRPSLWIESLWIDVSLNACCNNYTENNVINRMKAGYVPFSLGRGIALGDSYGTAQSFLGVLIEESDYKMPGFIFYGTLPNEKIEYKVFLGKPESRSATEGQVLGLSRQHIIDSSPFGGSWQDDYILATQVDFKLEAPSRTKNKDLKDTITLSPYLLYFNAPAKRIEMEADSNFELITLGFSSDVKIRKFSFGFDVAVNRGSQRALRIDRNSLTIDKDDLDGKLVERFSHITKAVIAGKQTKVNPAYEASEENAVADKLLIEKLNADLRRDGVVFSINDINYISKADRIRPAYTNKYKGYMGVFDADLSFDSGVVLAMTAGYASGDKNPNKLESDSDYRGFVGINETYSSKKVPSLIILGGIVKRPLTLDEGKEAKLKDYLGSSLTDIYFVGGGLSISPVNMKENKAKIAVNTLCFWKEYPGHKVQINNNKPVFSKDLARNYLGTEFNISASIELLENLTFSVKFALFKPGSYYTDIKGAVLDNEITKMLSKRDSDGINSQTYSIGNDSCHIFNAELKYTF